MRRKGFTLIELLVVIAIIALLVTLLLPKLTQARALAKRATCMASLNGIGKSLIMYSETTKMGWPVINMDYADPEAVLGTPTDVELGDGGENWSALGENAMQNVWLLIRAGLVSENAFKCAAHSATDREDPDPNATVKKFGWYETSNYSYGMQWPYNGPPAPAVGNQAPFHEDLEGTVVIFADRNPGAIVDADQKPSNHGKLGTCYLTAAGSVNSHNFEDSSTCGMNGDDIYSKQNPDGTNSALPGMPVTDEDTYICLP